MSSRHELLETWSFEDHVDAHLTLDLLEEAERQASKNAAQAR